MKKYAMVPINRRYENGKRIVRRVLISYSRKANGVYQKVKLLAKHPYFDNPMSSQQYVFTDKYFYLVSDAYNDSQQQSLLNVKRKYEYNPGLLLDVAIEFEARSDSEAIKIFHKGLGL